MDVEWGADETLVQVSCAAPIKQDSLTEEPIYDAIQQGLLGKGLSQPLDSPNHD